MTPERRAAEEEAAQEYADFIRADGRDGRYHGRDGWAERNIAIIERWSVTALLRIKRRAWQIVEADW